jgi:hypothetical protein
MQYGSLQNLLLGSAVTPREPVVGDAATIIRWTDRVAATVIAVSANGKTVQVQCDHARRIDDNGMSECQQYEYTRDPGGAIGVFTKRKTGGWVAQGATIKTGSGLLIGHRDHFYDFSF